MKKFIASALALSMIAGMVCLPVSAEAYDEITTDMLVTDGEDINAAATTVESYLKTGFDVDDFQIYNGTSSTGFKVNGRTYYTGIIMTGSGASISYNTKNVKKISFDIAHLDGENFGNNVLYVYYDGELYNKYELTANMAFMPIELEVADVSKLTFKTENYNSYKYAMVNFKVDGVKTAKAPTVPTYASSDKLMHAIYNNWDVDIYDSSKKLGFKMNGRTYYNGLVLNSGAAFSLNTEKINSLTFDLGHLDNAKLYGSKIDIYFDNELYDTIECTFNQPVKSYSLNLKNVDNVRFVCEKYTSTSYAMGNIQFDKVKVPKTYAKPTYSNAVDFIKSNYNSDNIEIFDGSKKLGFDIDSKNYKQGIIMNDGSNMTFNVENVGSLSFTLGHVDGSKYSNATIMVYFDDQLKDEITLNEKVLTKNYSYDLTGIKNVYFLQKKTYGGQRYALADIKISKNAPAFMKGDVDNNKQINVTDISMIASHIKGQKALSAAGVKAADVDGNNQVTVADIATIAAHIKGIKALK